MSETLDDSEVASRLKKVPEWEWENGNKAITRDVEFDEFMEGIDFLNDVAEIAEEASHHPDIDIRYTKIRLSLTTHSQGGLTSMDFELASRIDNLID